MSLGQFVAQSNLRMGLHLNADANDFSGNSLNGTASNVTYASGVIGGNGAAFNGSNAKIALNSGLDTPLKTASFTILFLLKTETGWENSYGINRGIVNESGNYYGIGLLISTTTILASRNEGTTSNITQSLSATLAENKKYLIGWTYNKSSGASIIYFGNLLSGEFKKGSSTLGTGNVAFHTSYDVGYNLNANLRNVSDGYGKGTLNECIVFSDIKTEVWFKQYFALLRGMID